MHSCKYVGIKSAVNMTMKLIIVRKRSTGVALFLKSSIPGKIGQGLAKGESSMDIFLIT
ncbi:14487_t:CDS:2, partial [Acaulospora morrowiae]